MKNIYPSEHHAKWVIGLDTKSISPFTVIGSSGRTKCPVSVDRWHSQSLDERSFLQLSPSEEIKVECGSVWSEWSEPDSNGCGDRFRYRTRLDNFGIAEKETQNIGYVILISQQFPFIILANNVTSVD